MLDLEETTKQEENEEKDNKTDTHSSDSKGDNTKKEDKINTDSSEKSQDKRKEDTRQDSTSDQEATGDNTEPREEEGNKDPGGVNGAQTPASDGDTDNSQGALNGECQRSNLLIFCICLYPNIRDNTPYHVHISNKIWCLLCLTFFLHYF